MKKMVTYILLYSYTLMLLKPVLPLVCDITAHIFWYSNHIATVHAENGQYHLHYESLEAAKKSFPEKNKAVTKTQVFITEHNVPNQQYAFTPPVLMLNHTAMIKFITPNGYLDNEIQPPKI